MIVIRITWARVAAVVAVFVFAVSCYLLATMSLGEDMTARLTCLEQLDHSSPFFDIRAGRCPAVDTVYRSWPEVILSSVLVSTVVSAAILATGWASRHVRFQRG